MSKARDLAGIFNLNPTSGTTAQRPATAEVGEIYYNGTTGKTQIYTPTGWQDMASGIPFGNTAGRPTGATGQPYFNGEIGRLEMYTSSTGWQNIVQETPGIAAVTGSYNESTGYGDFAISGTNFVNGAIAYAVGTNGIEYQADTTTVNSIVVINARFSSLSNLYEPYDIKVMNPSNLFGILTDAFYINASPSWITSAGNVGTAVSGSSLSVSLSATDSDGTVTYSSSNKPSWVTLNTSTGALTGTYPKVFSDTTYSFTVSASDGLNTITRNFTLISQFADGTTSAKAAESATDILLGSPSASNGYYWIKGTGTTPYYLYCSMTSGGWISWLHYRDTSSGSITVDVSMPTTATSYNLSSDSAFYDFQIPSALLTNARYAAFSSSEDVGASPTSDSSFKYLLEFRNTSGTLVFNDLYTWMTAAKNANTYGVVSALNTSEPRQNTGSHKRYGTSFSTIQYGANASNSGNTEFETFHFRNLDGTGSYNWGSNTGSIYQYGGWGVTDGSRPGSGNPGYGSFGRDNSNWSGTKLSDRLFGWFK